MPYKLGRFSWVRYFLWGKESKEGGKGVDRTGDERRDQGAGRREQGLPFLSSRSANEAAGGLAYGPSGC